MSIIRNPRLAEEGRRKIEWVQDFMPVLTRIGEDFAKRQVFSGIKIGMSIHMEAKTAYLALMLQEAGAKVYATGCNPLSTQDDVAAGLCSLGVNVYAVHGVNEIDYFKHLDAVLRHRPNLLIDDGGDLYEAYAKLPDAKKWRLIGGCEETTTGVNRLKARQQKGQLYFPMININDAKCKHYYDNKYGTGQSVWDAIMHITNTLIAGKIVVVAGYGYCGRGIAMRARGMGAKVIVTEIDSVKAIEAVLDGFDVANMDDAAYYGDYFITATGCKDIITKRHFGCMKNNAFLANAGHFDVEINLDELKALSVAISERRDDIVGYTMTDGRVLNLLASGRLVNLAAGNGHPAEIMDLSFSLQMLGLEYLLNNRKKLKKIIHEIPDEINDYVADLKLQSLGIEIDSLTESQKRYLNF